jgi:hypothetical protein
MRDEDKEFIRLLGAIDESLRDLNQTMWGWKGPFHVVIDTPQPPPITATKAVLTYAGDTMANTQLTVDTTNGKVTVGFLDDKGDAGATPPTGLTIAWSSTGASTLAQDPSDPLSADITVGTDGDTGNFVAAFNGTALEADGVTQIADPAPFPYTVTAGQAVSASLSES